MIETRIETRKTRRLREIIGTLTLKMYLGEGGCRELRDEANKLASGLQDLAVRRVAYDAVDDIMGTITRRQCHKDGVWITREWQSVHVSDMTDSHLLNVARMLRKKAADKAARISSWYVSYPEPRGEMAQVAFEHEAEYWLDSGNPVYDILKQQPIWEFIEAEINKRGLRTEAP